MSAVEARQVRLRVQHAGPLADESQRLGEQPAREPLPARRRRHHHPADPRHPAGIGQDPQVRHDRTVALQPEVAGAGFDVAPVQLRVRALLLDDEDIDTQFQQVMEGASGELAEGGDVQPEGGGGHAPSLTATGPASFRGGDPAGAAGVGFGLACCVGSGQGGVLSLPEVGERRSRSGAFVHPQNWILLVDRGGVYR